MLIKVCIDVGLSASNTMSSANARLPQLKSQV